MKTTKLLKKRTMLKTAMLLSAMLMFNNFAFSQCSVSIFDSAGVMLYAIPTGTAPFTYLWSSGETTDIISPTSSGQYCVTITDNLGCSDSTCYQFVFGCTLSSTISSTDASCGTCADGSATVTASGGTTPYTYLWDDPLAQITAMATGLLPGTYCVTVTDSAGCTINTCVTIANGQCGTLSSTISGVDASCPTCADGSATVTATGGTLPYTYAWYKDSLLWGTTATITGLLPGYYCITVTDALGCTSSGCVSVDSTCQFPLALFGYSISGATVDFSDLSINATGWSWDFGDSSAIDNNQNPPTHTYADTGTYTVCLTVTNACGSGNLCTVIPISVPANCSVFIYDSAGVALYAIPTQGTAPFTYLWSSGETTQSITPASSGIYCVTVTDNSGCTASACYQFNSGVCNAYFFPYIDSTQANVLYLIENSVGNNLTYFWDFGDGNTSTQQFPAHTYNSYGTYNICLTINDSIGGCVDIFCMLVQLDSINKTFLGYSVIVIPDPFGTSTSINNEESNYTETKIYPNPASSKVYIELTGWGASATITLFNVLGQVLSREVILLNPGKNTVELDLNNYHKGLYFLRIDSGKLRETKRISKIY